MIGTHPTAVQLDRYRRRASAPAELLEVDGHIATCDRCFEAVRADAHLTFEQMAQYVADGAQRGYVKRHIALCDVCRGEVRDLEQLRDVMRRPRGRRTLQWIAAAAAILIFVFVAAFMFRSETPQPVSPAVQTAKAPPPRAVAPSEIVLQKPAVLGELVTEEHVLRSGETPQPSFALHAPIATVVLDDRPRFAWQAATNATSYDVVVADLESSAIAAHGESGTTTWRPERPLPRGRTYAWQVTAHTGLESIVSPGAVAPEARFRVAPGTVAAEVDARKTALDRGIALAERGVLDDAERELQRAIAGGETRATSLLQQVRAWRSGVDYRLLPTITNGAQ